jgi:hypothetical protein
MQITHSSAGWLFQLGGRPWSEGPPNDQKVSELFGIDLALNSNEETAAKSQIYAVTHQARLSTMNN